MDHGNSLWRWQSACSGSGASEAAAVAALALDEALQEMSDCIEGDEWKRAEPARGRTRAQVQEEIDRDYANGRISLENWRAVTNALSEPPTLVRRRSG